MSEQYLNTTSHYQYKVLFRTLYNDMADFSRQKAPREHWGKMAPRFVQMGHLR